jgi:uncharacterized membrane protein YkoI
MRVLTVVLPSLLGLAIGLAATPASADRYVDIEDVRAMAFDVGIVKLEEIELRRRKGVWKVEGEDASGHEIEMKVDARTGRIIKMERD